MVFAVEDLDLAVVSRKRVVSPVRRPFGEDAVAVLGAPDPRGSGIWTGSSPQVGVGWVLLTTEGVGAFAGASVLVYRTVPVPDVRGPAGVCGAGE